jgi:hypothetical protein
MDDNTIPKTPEVIVRAPTPKGRTQIVPAGVTAGIALLPNGIAPHKKESFSTHPDAGPAILYSFTIQRIEGLEALRQANLAEIGRPLSGSGFGEIGQLLWPRHKVVIGIQLCLLCERKPLYGRVGGAASQHNQSA